MGIPIVIREHLDIVTAPRSFVPLTLNWVVYIMHYFWIYMYYDISKYNVKAVIVYAYKCIRL